MTPNLESFRPKLRSGRVIPQGSRIIFETDNPYNQIVLPMAMADFVLLCSGQFSVREIIDRVYKKQGAVPFKSILGAIHVLHQNGFFENGDQLVLSSQLQSWMEPRRNRWQLAWRFGQRIAAANRSPVGFYLLTLCVLLGAIFGLQEFPSHPLRLTQGWSRLQPGLDSLIILIVTNSIVQSVRYLLCGLQLLLLTSKAYNVSLMLSPWGLHLHVGDEANDLFENRLYTSMYHTSQILVGWALVAFANQFGPREYLTPLVLASALLTFWELNPFRNSEWRKLVRALLIANDGDVVSWHFETNQLINSIHPEARRQHRDFARISAVWGFFWVAGSFFVLQRVSRAFGPNVLNEVMHPRMTSIVHILGLVAWLSTLYYVAQALVETILISVVRPYVTGFYSRVVSRMMKTTRNWTTAEITKGVEALPLFSHFHEQFLEKIVVQSQVQAFNAGTSIVRQNEPARELFVLLDGKVEVVRRDASGKRDWVTELEPISVFGESALVDDAPRAAEVLAKSPAHVLRVPIHVLRQVALESQSVRQLEVFRNAILVNQFFTSSPVFRSLSPSSVDFLCSRGTLEYSDADQMVFHQGDSGDSLYLILRGAVEVSVHGFVVKHLRQGSFFGEIALIANIPRTASVKALEACVFFKVSADSFWDVLVQHMDLGVFIETVSETRLKEDLAMAAPQRSTGNDPN